MKRSKWKYRKIAVLQLSRIGDIIMSLPVLEAFSKKYTGVEISFFINGMFENLLPKSPFFRMVPLHFNAIYEKLAEADTIEDAFAILDGHMGEHLTGHFDLVVNLSGQRISAILASLLNAKDRRGLILSEDQSLVHAHPGLSLFTRITAGRKINWVHQVEIFLSSMNGFKPRSVYETGNYLFGGRIRSTMNKRLIAPKYVLISPGASIPQKELGRNVLISIIQSLLAHTNYHIILSGTEKEASRHGEMELPNSNRIIDYAGKSVDFNDLLRLIHHAECLISNDSGPMHMAALLNKKNIVFSVGSAFFPETAGYNRNVMILTPAGDCYPCPWIDITCQQDLNCKEKFNPNLITDRMLAYITDKNPNVIDSGGFSFKTEINEYGLVFIPQRGTPLSTTQFFGVAYQSFWKEKLLGINADDALTYLLGHYEFDRISLQNAILPIEADLGKFSAFLDQLLLWFAEFKRQKNPRVFDRIKGGIDTIFAASDEETVLGPLLQYYKVIFHSIATGNPNKIVLEYDKTSMALKKDLHRLNALVTPYIFSPDACCRLSNDSWCQ